MEDAVRRHLGAITPPVAAQIIRDRTNSIAVNDATVANLFVLNAAVIQPATKTLWHSTTMQPEAPFGEMLPFSVGADVSTPPPLAADPRLATPEMEREHAVVALARRAVRAFDAGDFATAGGIWDALAARAQPILHPDRLAWARAAVRWKGGDLDGADRLLAEVDLERAPFEIAACTQVGRAVIADQRGRREDAVAHYRHARDYLGTHPEYTDDQTEHLRTIVARGLEAPLAIDAVGPLPDLQYVPE